MSRIHKHMQDNEMEMAREFSKLVKLPWHLYEEENLKNFELVFKRKFNENDKLTKTILETKNIKNNASNK